MPEGSLDMILAVVADVLGYESPADVDPELPFAEQGVDSLLAVELRERLAGLTGIALPSTVVFDAPTPLAAAAYLDGARQQAPAMPEPVAGDPIVIVGMACRFPGGVDSPEQLWEMLVDEREGIAEFPDDRGWDYRGHYDAHGDRPGSLYVRGGGFLDRVQAFDAGFFGISPREALATDPQQRLLLETTWEAIERAGIDPVTLAGTETGVFAGMFNSEYATRLAPIFDQVEGYYTTGTMLSVGAGRVAYALGLQGPAMTVDTACSSSLVALHLAAQALRNGECTLAVAGGVTVMADLRLHIDFCRDGALSKDGRCRSFADGTDGFGPAEGAGMLILERMSDAVRAGRRVLAVIRGSAVNQDGASNGLTAPNGAAQQRVIRRALHVAGLDVTDVDVIEAHGTGTPLGDPIEAHALLATYGRRPAGEPALLGSVKSNIGHTQAAAGVAGVIKSVLAIRHGVVPRSLHSEKPSGKVDWDAGEVRLVQETQAWPDRGRPRRTGISGFGVSGTNAHVILEQSPFADPALETVDGPAVWTFAAKTTAALRAYATRLQAADAPDLAVAGRALQRSRSAFVERAVVFGRDRAELLHGLAAVAAGDRTAGAVTGSARRSAGPVLVFPGQDSPWPGMARALLASSPQFAAWIAECDRAFRPYVDWSLTEVLERDTGLDRVDVAPPALFAVMAGIARLWEHHGVRPAAVIGHSQGEIAGAYVAGILSLDDAARAATMCGRAIAALAGGGAAALMPGRAETERRLLDALAPIRPSASDVTFCSTVTGTPMDGTGLDAAYWYRNLRGTVRFEDAVRTLLASGHRTFIEVSPHPVLTTAISRIDADATVLHSLHRDQPSAADLAVRVAAAYTAGIDIDWETILPPASSMPVDLPTYPFQRRDYWPGAVVAKAPDRTTPTTRAEALELVRATIAHVLGHDSIDGIGPDQGLWDLGIDSLASTQLQSELNAATGASLPVTLVFDYPTPSDLADGILEAVGHER